MNEVYRNSGLGKWFHSQSAGGEPGWDRYNTKGERVGECGDSKPGEGKPKCLSKQKAAKLRSKGGKSEIAKVVRKKKRKDPQQDRPGTGNKPINVSNFDEDTKMKSFTEFLMEENVPTDPSKWAASIAAAKKKFDVYPSAYANAWASKDYKSKGGGWKKKAKKANESVELDEHIVKHRDGQYVSHMDGDKIKGVVNDPAKAKKFKNKSEAEKVAKIERGSKVIARNTLVSRGDDPKLDLRRLASGGYVSKKESVEVNELKTTTYKSYKRKSDQQVTDILSNKKRTRGRHDSMTPEEQKLFDKRANGSRIANELILRRREGKHRDPPRPGRERIQEEKKNCGCEQDPCITYGTQNEALDSKDKPTLKRIIKKLKGASQAHAGQAKDLESAMKKEDWQKANREDKTDGLSQKAVNAYRRENPGSKLKTAVTEKNPSGKRAGRRKSFCSRMCGMKSKLTSAETSRDPDSRINKALRRWNCNCS